QEVAHHLTPARLQRAHQVVEDTVGDRLVECSFVAEAPQVELERLQLDAELVGHVGDADGGEIRLARHRAQAGELRALEADFIIPLRLGIRESLEILGRRRGHRSEIRGHDTKLRPQSRRPKPELSIVSPNLRLRAAAGVEGLAFRAVAWVAPGEAQFRAVPEEAEVIAEEVELRGL